MRSACVSESGSCRTLGCSTASFGFAIQHGFCADYIHSDSNSYLSPSFWFSGVLKPHSDRCVLFRTRLVFAYHEVYFNIYSVCGDLMIMKLSLTTAALALGTVMLFGA